MNILYPAGNELLNTFVILSKLLAAFKFLPYCLGSVDNLYPGIGRFHLGSCCTTYKVLVHPLDSLTISGV